MVITVPGVHCRVQIFVAGCRVYTAVARSVSTHAGNKEHRLGLSLLVETGVS